eukprot:TRINITY_DN9742_c0_g2_i2.p1 TRINITY_DN9742_c0_g2~~TRINITY_DN9742_c0_g2_i2.p1  ORF type:complete len:392 (-),score=100.30 TRINITY_DN9742_c0_g2_i2:60-1235(-)
MSEPYRRLEIKKYPKKLLSDTPENKFWKRFESIHSKEESGAITSIAGRNDADLIAYSSGLKVQIFKLKKEQLITVKDNYRSTIVSTAFRKDGRVLAVGEETGTVLLHETKKRNIMRTFNKHDKAVHAIAFKQGESHILTGSDDLTVKLYDYGIDSIVKSYERIHTDYIRAVKFVDDNTYLSGGYDSWIHLIDMRAKKPVSLSFEHGSPVEDLDYIGETGRFLSVGGVEVKLWDIRDASSTVASSKSNQKNLTRVRALGSLQRFATTSIDQLLKIYDLNNFEVVHQHKFGAPILSFELAEDAAYFAVGQSDGRIELLRRKVAVSAEGVEEEEKEQDELSMIEKLLKFKDNRVVKDYRYFNRGIYETPSQYEKAFEEPKPKKLKDYELSLIHI